MKKKKNIKIKKVGLPSASQQLYIHIYIYIISKLRLKLFQENIFLV